MRWSRHRTMWNWRRWAPWEIFFCTEGCAEGELDAASRSGAVLAVGVATPSGTALAASAASPAVVDGGAGPGARREARPRSEAGQGTVEAALAIPILMLLILLLIQPGIILYDRMVMQAAAAEGCRLLATSTDSLGSMHDSCEAFIRHRLGSIPQQACFHVHEGANGCSWKIAFSGDELSHEVGVRIENEVRPLPLLDAGATLLNLTNAEGNLVVEASASMPAQPGWAQEAFASATPQELVGAWVQ